MAIINREDQDTTLTITTDGELLINFGDLTTTADLEDGIFAGANDVKIRHFGSIETSGLGAAGIFVQGNDARIENHGSVVTHGDFFGDFEFFSEGIFALGDRFYIANHGSVQVEGFGSSGLVGVGNDGLIVNFGAVNSSATESVVVAAFGDRSQVINRGQVAAIGDDNSVLRVLGEDASALNQGEILVTGDHSVGVSGVVADTHLTNMGVIRVTGDGSWGMQGGGDGHQITNFGLVETLGTFAAGIVMAGRGGPLNLPGSDFEVANAGRISTSGELAFGVALGVGDDGFNNAVAGQIENRGVIETVGAGAAGVVMIGNGHHLANSGRITTDGDAFVGDPFGEFRAAGVVVSGDDALLENTRTGIIESRNAASAAVDLNVLERDGLPAAGMSSTLENFGLIKGAGVAVLGGAGEEHVINHGRIVGDVDLGAGNDEFVFGKGGVLEGALFLGTGDDVVRIENGSGTTQIVDFVSGEDSIDVSAFFSDPADLAAAVSDTGDDLVIALDKNDELVLVGVPDFSAADFGLV